MEKHQHSGLTIPHKDKSIHSPKCIFHIRLMNRLQVKLYNIKKKKKKRKIERKEAIKLGCLPRSASV